MRSGILYASFKGKFIPSDENIIILMLIECDTGNQYFLYVEATNYRFTQGDRFRWSDCDDADVFWYTPTRMTPLIRHKPEKVALS